MTTALIAITCITGTLSLIAVLGFNEMRRRAKADPIHAQHD